MSESIVTQLHEAPVPARILLVDDNAANLIALEAVLEPLGQDLLFARSGKEALDLLNEHVCALVLMDVHMPILDGFQTVERIRTQSSLRHLPVLFLTALFQDPASVSRGYALGAIDFILKPFDPDIIRSKVGAFVRLYQYNEQIRRQHQRIVEEVALRRAAEHTNRTRDEFIAILGHDLRNPLGAIMLAAEKHALLPDAQKPCQETGERIARSAGRMQRLINDVLDFARSRLGSGIPIKTMRADMAELCRVPLEECRGLAPGREISFVGHGDVHGSWDPDRVAQVVANLVGNAVKYGNPDAPIRVSLEGTSETVWMRVHNVGAPIPASTQSHLFQPFKHDGRDREGLGLGLYIVQQIIQAHGGTISVESSEVAGTTFTVRWPRHVLAGHELAPTHEAPLAF